MMSPSPGPSRRSSLPQQAASPPVMEESDLKIIIIPTALPSEICSSFGNPRFVPATPLVKLRKTETDQYFTSDGMAGGRPAPPPPPLSSRASVGLTDYYQVDILGLRYKPVKFGGGKRYVAVHMESESKYIIDSS